MRNQSLIAVILIVLACVSGNACAQPFGYAVNSDSDSTDDAIIDNLFRINLATGESERIGPVGYLDIEGLAFNQEGILFGADDDTNTLVEIDLTTGDGNAVGGSDGNLLLNSTTFFDFGLTFSCADSRPLLSSDNQQMLFRVEIEEDIQANTIGNTSNVPITGLATWSVDGIETIYGLGAGDVAPDLYEINPQTGAATLIGPLTGAAEYNDGGIAFDSTGQLWAITDRTLSSGGPESQILQIDITNGEATPIATTLSGVETLAITALDCGGLSGGSITGEIPEVPTLSRLGLLMLFGLFLIIGFSLKRRQQT